MFASSSYAKKYKLTVIANLKISGFNDHLCVVDVSKHHPQTDIPSSSIDLIGEHSLSFEFPPVAKHELKRHIFYIAAPSGAGKTSYAADLALRYRAAYPKNKIVYFNSSFNDNPVLKKLHPIIINLSDSDMQQKNLYDPETQLRVIEEDMSTSMFENTLNIFDDLEGITDKKVLTDIQEKLVYPMLNIGRHKNISVIFCKHLLLDYTKTRNILVEMDYLVIFPSSSRRQIRNCLDRYLGLEKEQIDRIMNCGERSVTIHCKYPMFAFTRSSAWII